MDKGLNQLLKWGIENTTAASGATATDGPDAAPPAAAPTNSGLNPEILAALFGGPSDADLMKASMAVITSKDADETLENRLVAFDNFEQLVESLDNANLMDKLALWTPLLGVLESDEPELRRMAAWCVGTAVQNNQPSQERLLAMGGLPPLVKVAANASETEGVRRKAIYALSSACRNYQPAMDACLLALSQLETKVPTLSALPAAVDATNMDAVDEIINGLKSDLAK
ncbi:hsp70-like protein [Ophiostoma piceae UAMH 11346]|uniref:Hsp70-like protein n=1 Tax=Ophiostoma piceae (strain UAMH 11346) TaxID=1262450 RepID=S3BSK9_OPHP1|nr:hsp70-like protein [Ophiostoma piceae UAMH 11346]